MTVTHGQSRTPTHRAWCNMLGRCNNSNASHYEYYGGRGITVCERWLKFENFLADMGLKPGPGFSVDRKNGKGNYEPGNCRWATHTQQMRNTSLTTMLEFRGEVHALGDWCELFSIKPNSFRSRRRYGWSLEEAFTTPTERPIRNLSTIRQQRSLQHG